MMPVSSASSSLDAAGSIGTMMALLTALGSVLSACANGNTFNYGHGQGQCVNCGDHY
jgi:hypothetical protein